MASQRHARVLLNAWLSIRRYSNRSTGSGRASEGKRRTAAEPAAPRVTTSADGGTTVVRSSLLRQIDESTRLRRIANEAEQLRRRQEAAEQAPSPVSPAAWTDEAAENGGVPAGRLRALNMFNADLDETDVADLEQVDRAERSERRQRRFRRRAADEPERDRDGRRRREATSGVPRGKSMVRSGEFDDEADRESWRRLQVQRPMRQRLREDLLARLETADATAGNDPDILRQLTPPSRRIWRLLHDEVFRKEQVSQANVLLTQRGPAAVRAVTERAQSMQAELQRDMERKQRHRRNKELQLKNRHLPPRTYRADTVPMEDAWLAHAVQQVRAVLRDARSGMANAPETSWLDAIAHDLLPQARNVQEVVYMLQMLRKAVKQVSKWTEAVSQTKA